MTLNDYILFESINRIRHDNRLQFYLLIDHRNVLQRTNDMFQIVDI